MISGSILIDRDQLDDCLQFPAQVAVNIPDGVFRARRIIHLLNEGQRGTPDTLMDRFHDQKCADPSDRVYALLGMRSDHFQAPELVPDYNLEVIEVLQKAPKLLIPCGPKPTFSNDGLLIPIIVGVKYLGLVTDVLPTTPIIVLRYQDHETRLS